VGVAISATVPVGVPDPVCGATVAAMLTGWPSVMLAGVRFVSVVVLGVKVTLLHAFTRLLAFTDPNPVARS
jgi:hypothetical protein